MDLMSALPAYISQPVYTWSAECSTAEKDSKWLKQIISLGKCV